MRGVNDIGFSTAFSVSFSVSKPVSLPYPSVTGNFSIRRARIRLLALSKSAGSVSIARLPDVTKGRHLANLHGGLLGSVRLTVSYFIGLPERKGAIMPQQSWF